VDAIAQDDIMTNVTIIRRGQEAENWNATAEFAKVYDARKAEDQKKQDAIAKIAAMSEADYKAYFFSEVKKKYPNAQQTASGLVYIIENKGSGKPAEKGNKLSVHYTGTLMNGEKFDSSHDRGQPMSFTYKVQPMVPGFEEGLAMLGKGGKGKFFIPYFGAYGKNGRAPQIPAYSDLVFDLEIVDILPQ
jgi:FKBP-type peptidyl-prolyl cis-trans isomerase